MLRLAVVGLAASCGGDEIVVPSTTLERPAAVAFVCAKGGSPVALSECKDDDGGDLFALLANSARGELALAEVTEPKADERVHDLDPASPGVQHLWVGPFVADVAVSSPVGEGAPPVQVVTANHGSCDLGLIGVQVLLDAPDSAPVASRVVPRSGGAELGARPRAVAFVPGSTEQVYALFLGCGLLARIDLASGDIVEAISILADGTAALVADPVCAAECPGIEDRCGAGGCPASAQPVDFDVADDRSLLIVSAAEAPFLTAVPLGPDGTLGAPSVVPLEGDAGTEKVRISPATTYGRFAYAASRDGSVRVVSLSELRECETNPDPRAGIISDPSGCVPVGTPRRPLPEGPGIEFSDQRLTVDIAFSTLDAPPEGTPESATFYDGIFAFVLTSDGTISVVNLEDRTYPDAIPHTRRTARNRFVSDAGEYLLPFPLVGNIDGEGDRFPEAPRRFLGSVEPLADRYPRLLDRTAEDAENFGVRFPDPLRTASADVTLWYEGVLPGTSRSTGLLDFCSDDEAVREACRRDPRSGSCTVCLRDAGAEFCDKGVESGDIVQLLGCSSDSGCRAGEICQLDPVSAVEDNGVCVCDEDADPAVDQCLRPGCASRPREYSIARAWADRLELPDLDGGCFSGVRVRYTNRAGDALVLSTDQLPFQHRVVTDTDGSCMKDPAKSPLLQSKIALDPPPCVDTIAPDPNPCSARSLVRHGHPLYDLTLENMADRPPRDLETEFTMTFEVDGPFSPLELDAQSYLPAAMELGPDGKLYIVDSGDEIGGTGRGRLVRMSPREHELDEFVIR